MSYNPLSPARTRGLLELCSRVGDVTLYVDAFLKTQKPVRVLEVGYGYGVALMELRKLFKSDVDLYGVNKMAAHGNWEMIKRTAILKRLYSSNALKRIVPPRLFFGDVSKGLPFPDRYFDLVYSQVAFVYFNDKIAFLEAVNRVLKKNGIAKIAIGHNLPKSPSCLEIWDGDRQIPTWDFLESFPNLCQKKGLRGAYLEMRKTNNLDMGLKLRSTTTKKKQAINCVKVKSVYELR